MQQSTQFTRLIQPLGVQQMKNNYACRWLGDTPSIWTNGDEKKSEHLQAAPCGLRFFKVREHLESFAFKKLLVGLQWFFHIVFLLSVGSRSWKMTEEDCCLVHAIYREVKSMGKRGWNWASRDPEATGKSKAEVAKSRTRVQAQLHDSFSFSHLWVGNERMIKFTKNFLARVLMWWGNL